MNETQREQEKNRKILTWNLPTKFQKEGKIIQKFQYKGRFVTESNRSKKNHSKL